MGWAPTDAQNEISKGLLSYEPTYRRYNQLLLAESVKCKTQDANGRLNLISNKFINTNKPTEQYNLGIIDLVIGEDKNSKANNSGLSPPRVTYCITLISHVSLVESSLS